MDLSERISEAIAHSKKSDADIARETGKTPAAVSLWRSGEIKNLRAETAFALEAATGYRALWLTKELGPKLCTDTVEPLSHDKVALLALYDGLTATQKSELLKHTEATKQQNEALLKELLNRRSA